MEFFSEYDFEIVYIPGGKNVAADALSRMLRPEDVITKTQLLGAINATFLNLDLAEFLDIKPEVMKRYEEDIAMLVRKYLRRLLLV